MRWCIAKPVPDKYCGQIFKTKYKTVTKPHRTYFGAWLELRRYCKENNIEME